MTHVILDTDVVSKAFKRRLPPTLSARLTGRPTCITFVTFAELTQWTVYRHWGPRNREALTKWFADFLVLPADKNVAGVWGEISARTNYAGERYHRMIHGSLHVHW